jgi:hypothetical protein
VSFCICHYDECHSNFYVFKLSTTLLGVILSNITIQCHFAQRHSLECHFEFFHYGDCHNVSGIMMTVILMYFFLSAKCQSSWYCSAKCHSGLCHSAKCHSGLCHSAKCHSGLCHSAECRHARLVNCLQGECFFGKKFNDKTTIFLIFWENPQQVNKKGWAPTSSGSTVVEHLTHNIKIKSSNPANGIRRGQLGQKGINK